jgi:hypothetical protein
VPKLMVQFICIYLLLSPSMIAYFKSILKFIFSFLREDIRAPDPVNNIYRPYQRKGVLPESFLQKIQDYSKNELAKVKSGDLSVTVFVISWYHVYHVYWSMVYIWRNIFSSPRRRWDELMLYPLRPRPVKVFGVTQFWTN